MQLGIFAKTFSRATLPETLDAVAESGLRTMQFNMALAGGVSLPDEIPTERPCPAPTTWRTPTPPRALTATAASVS